MQVTVLKPDLEHPEGKRIVRFYNVERIITSRDKDNKSFYVLFLIDEPLESTPTFAVSDYYLLVE